MPLRPPLDRFGRTREAGLAAYLQPCCSRPRTMRLQRASTRSPRWTRVDPLATQVTGLADRTHVSAGLGRSNPMLVGSPLDALDLPGPVRSRAHRKPLGPASASSRSGSPIRDLACNRFLAAQGHHAHRPLPARCLCQPTPGCGLPCLGDGSALCRSHLMAGAANAGSSTWTSSPWYPS